MKSIEVASEYALNKNLKKRLPRLDGLFDINEMLSFIFEQHDDTVSKI